MNEFYCRYGHHFSFLGEKSLANSLYKLIFVSMGRNLFFFSRENDDVKEIMTTIISN